MAITTQGGGGLGSIGGGWPQGGVGGSGQHASMCFRGHIKQMMKWSIVTHM